MEFQVGLRLRVSSNFGSLIFITIVVLMCSGRDVSAASFYFMRPLLLGNWNAPPGTLLYPIPHELIHTNVAHGELLRMSNPNYGSVQAVLVDPGNGNGLTQTKQWSFDVSQPLMPSTTTTMAPTTRSPMKAYHKNILKILTSRRLTHDKQISDKMEQGDKPCDLVTNVSNGDTLQVTSSRSEQDTQNAASTASTHDDIQDITSSHDNTREVNDPYISKFVMTLMQQTAHLLEEQKIEVQNSSEAVAPNTADSKFEKFSLPHESAVQSTQMFEPIDKSDEILDSNVAASDIPKENIFESMRIPVPRKSLAEVEAFLNLSELISAFQSQMNSTENFSAENIFTPEEISNSQEEIETKEAEFSESGEQFIPTPEKQISENTTQAELENFPESPLYSPFQESKISPGFTMKPANFEESSTEIPDFSHPSPDSVKHHADTNHENVRLMPNPARSPCHPDNVNLTQYAIQMTFDPETGFISCSIVNETERASLAENVEQSGSMTSAHEPASGSVIPEIEISQNTTDAKNDEVENFRESQIYSPFQESQISTDLTKESQNFEKSATEIPNLSQPNPDSVVHHPIPNHDQVSFTPTEVLSPCYPVNANLTEFPANATFDPEPCIVAYTSVNETETTSLTEYEEPRPRSITSTHETAAGSMTSSDEAPSGSMTSSDEPPSGSMTSSDEAPSGSMTSSDEPPSRSITSSDEPPSGSMTSSDEPPSGSMTFTHEQPSGSLTFSNETPSGSMTANQEPVSGDVALNMPMTLVRVMTPEELSTMVTHVMTPENTQMGVTHVMTREDVPMVVTRYLPPENIPITLTRVTPDTIFPQFRLPEHISQQYPNGMAPNIYPESQQTPAAPPPPPKVMTFHEIPGDLTPETGHWLRDLVLKAVASDSKFQQVVAINIGKVSFKLDDGSEAFSIFKHLPQKPQQHQPAPKSKQMSTAQPQLHTEKQQDSTPQSDALSSTASPTTVLEAEITIPMVRPTTPTKAWSVDLGNPPPTSEYPIDPRSIEVNLGPFDVRVQGKKKIYTAT